MSYSARAFMLARCFLYKNFKLILELKKIINNSEFLMSILSFVHWVNSFYKNILLEEKKDPGVILVFFSLSQI